MCAAAARRPRPGEPRPLGANATSLSRLGSRTADVGRPRGFELGQAAGDYAANEPAAATDVTPDAPGAGLTFTRSFRNTITNPYRAGPFGRGWTHNWDTTAITEPSGGVTVLPGGSPRRFVRPSGGSFRGGPGDVAILTLAGWASRLRESHGAVTQFHQDGRLDFVEDPNGNRVTAG